MNKKTLKRRKGGFSLVECIVALLLFSIIITSVLTAFNNSHEQSEIHNEEYKADLIVNNVLAAYEGSNDLQNFFYLLNKCYPGDSKFPNYNDYKEAIATFSKTIKGGGEGKTVFDPNSIPLAVKFDTVNLASDKATLKTSKGTTVVTLGDYPDNKLQNDTKFNFKWSDVYAENGVTLSGRTTIKDELTVTGLSLLHPTLNIDYDYTLNNDKVTLHATIDKNALNMDEIIEEASLFEFITNKIKERINSAIVNVYGRPDKTVSEETCDFDEFLLKNGYYLECIGQNSYTTKYTLKNGNKIVGVVSDATESVPYYVFYFRVMNIADGKAVTKTEISQSGESTTSCLYYKITVATDSEINRFTKGIWNNMAEDNVEMYLDFSKIQDGRFDKHIEPDSYYDAFRWKNVEYEKEVFDAAYGKMEFAYAAENANYNDISFEGNILKNSDGSYFTGKWYYLPWLYYKTYVYNNKNNLDIKPNADDSKETREYYIKDNIKKEFSYALTIENSDDLLLFNSDDVLVLKCSKNSLSTLITECDFGKPVPEKTEDEETPEEENEPTTIVEVEKGGKTVEMMPNSAAEYKGATYDKWYHAGSMPDWYVTGVKFEEDENGVSKIIFLGAEDKSTKVDSSTPFITFYYDDYEQFITDRNTILEYNGSADNYAKYYIYTKEYEAKEKKNITDASELKKYETYEAFDGVDFCTNETVEEITLLYYKVDNERVPFTSYYDHEFKYYSYKITKTKTVTITDYQETFRNLKIEKSGDQITVTESLGDAATVKTVYNYSIDVVSNGNTKSYRDKKSTLDPLPEELSYGTNTDKKKENPLLDSNYFDRTYGNSNTVLSNWLKNNSLSATSSTTNTVTGIVSPLPHDSIPPDLNENWTLTAEPKTAALYSPGKFYPSDSAYDESVFYLLIGDADNNTPVFTAHPTKTEVKAGVVEENPTDVKATGRYTSIGGDMIDGNAYTLMYTTEEPTDKRYSVGRCVFALVTYSNCTTSKETEPYIIIWVMPTDGSVVLPDKNNAIDLAKINGEDGEDIDIEVRNEEIGKIKEIYKDYLYYEYRKG